MTRSHSTSTWVATASVIAAATLAASTGLGAIQASQPEQDPVAALEQQNADLKALTDLAANSAFYLVLDPGAATLRLMLHGAELSRYQVTDVQVGRPSVAFIRRRSPHAWNGVIRSGGELDPMREKDRVEILVPPPGSAEDVDPSMLVPPPEETEPAPPRFHIRFPEGPAVEIYPSELPEGDRGITRLVSWTRAYFDDLAWAMTTWSDAALRLRIVLAPEDADALYRSLPPQVSLLVLSSPSGAATSAN